MVRRTRALFSSADVELLLSPVRFLKACVPPKWMLSQLIGKALLTLVYSAGYKIA
jgi:hypothetical protein